VTSVSNESYSGSYSIEVEANASGWIRAEYNFDTEIGEDYIISIYAKNASIGTEAPGFYMWEGFSNFNWQEILSPNWTQYTFNLTADATSAKILVYSGDPSVVGSTVYIDNISIVKVGGAGNWTLNNQDLYYNNGNVGIGTTTPDEKLSVNGNIHTKEVRVDLTGWSDFVFDNDYKLPTLQEVEQHIKEKGHLQNIPSAEEVEENGILLGDMNAKLLQKIEELTLYAIEQQKESQAKDSKIKGLEERLQKLEALFESKKSTNP